MVGTPAQPAGLSKSVDLQTLVSAVQNAVLAQNGIATNIKALNTSFASFLTAFATFLAAYPTPLSASVTWNPPNLAGGASELTTITVTGAAPGNYVQVSFSNDLQGMSLVGYVSAANTVTAVLSNLTGGSLDLASGTLKARVTTV